jgi:hypothetical protein
MSDDAKRATKLLMKHLDAATGCRRGMRPLIDTPAAHAEWRKAELILRNGPFKVNLKDWKIFHKQCQESSDKVLSKWAKKQDVRAAVLGAGLRLGAIKLEINREHEWDPVSVVHDGWVLVQGESHDWAYYMGPYSGVVCDSGFAKELREHTSACIYNVASTRVIGVNWITCQVGTLAADQACEFTWVPLCVSGAISAYTTCRVTSEMKRLRSLVARKGTRRPQSGWSRADSDSEHMCYPDDEHMCPASMFKDDDEVRPTCLLAEYQADVDAYDRRLAGRVQPHTAHIGERCVICGSNPTYTQFCLYPYWQKKIDDALPVVTKKRKRSTDSDPDLDLKSPYVDKQRARKRRKQRKLYGRDTWEHSDS